MVVATFGPVTAWFGKSITYDDGQFALEGYGPITAADVTEYDRQGHLQWAYAGLREWVYELAGQPLPAAGPADAGPADAGPATTEPPASEPPPAASAPSAGAADPTAPPAVDHWVCSRCSVEHLDDSAFCSHCGTPKPVAEPTAGAPAAAGIAALAAPPAATPPRAGPGWVGPVVLGAALALLLVLGIVLAGGRLRDGVGIALSGMAVVFIALLVWTAIKPVSASRVVGGIDSKALLAVSGALCAVCLVLAGVLWWMPHYEVIAPGDTRIALDDTPEITMEVVNRGLLGGTYSAAYAVDGVEQQKIDVPLGAGASRQVTLSLPSSVERGGVLLSLGGTSIEAKAVTPPTFVVAPLELDPAIAKRGDGVTLTTTVENTGDLGGTFGGELSVDGGAMLSQPVKVAAGANEAVTYEFDADKPGEFRLQLGDAEARFIVVEPVRPANGHVLKRSINGGRASLTITNKTGKDAVAVLAPSNNAKRAVLATYVRKGKKVTFENIPDGKYVFWDCCGQDFNWYMRDFYTPLEHKRWVKALKFDTTASTNYWTSYWSDWRYNYSQKHSRTTTNWTNWTVTLGTGESEHTKLVTAGAFPKM